MASVKSVNAGVHNSIGIEFQKHCALYILFENYNTLKNQKYFICIEHHDDILFCHQGSMDELTFVKSYQAKKSSDKWGLNDTFFEILVKMAETGVSLEEDPIAKSPKYSHSLNFLTNHAISFSLNQPKPKQPIKLLVNESNSNIHFLQLPIEIQNELNKKLKDKLNPNTKPLLQVNHISLAFIDLPKKANSQLNLLIGYFKTQINPAIADADAAVNTLIELFRKVENSLNNGNAAKLLDESKRVSSTDINNTIAIINNNQKAYNLWRLDGKEIARKLSINIVEQMSFEKSIQDSFDFFKDLKQVEHRNILRFTENNKTILYNSLSEVDCIEELYKKYTENHNSPLLPKELKAALIAAYIEIRETL